MKGKCLAVTTILACCFFALACAGSTPSSAVRAFYGAVAKGNTDDALSFISDEIVSTIGKDKLRTGLQEATRKALAKGGLQGIEILDEKITGDVATVTALLKYGDGTQEREVVQLGKEKGGWRLKPRK